MQVNNKHKLWASSIKEQIEQCDQVLLPMCAMREVLRSLVESEFSPLATLHVVITHFGVTFDSGLLGAPTSSEPQILADPLTSHGFDNANVTLRYWKAEGNLIASSDWYPLFLRLLNTMWLPEARQSRHGAIDIKHSTVLKRLVASLDELAKGSPHGIIYCIYSDLDHFKNLNDQAGHHAGDQAISHLAACSERLAHESPLISTCQGGDEFVFFVPDRGELSLLEMLSELRQQVKSRKFGNQGLSVDLTSGAIKLDRWTAEDIQRAQRDAEEATKDSSASEGAKKEKKRGTVNVAGMLSEPTRKADLSKFLKLGISISRTRVTYAEPFSNIFLNYISKVTSKAWSASGPGSVVGAVDEAVRWLGITPTDTPYEEELVGQDSFPSSFSHAGIAVAVYHGVLKASSGNSGPKVPRFSLKIDSRFELVALFADGNFVWGYPEECTHADLDGGGTIDLQSENEEIDGSCASAVVLNIGVEKLFVTNGNLALPENIFAEVIYVDDRPHLGGGLPDFWQVAIAQLVSCLERRINVRKILIIGDATSAPETVKRIQHAAKEDLDELSRATAVSRPLLKQHYRKIGDSVVVEQVPSTDTDALIEAVYLSALEMDSWTADRTTSIAENRPEGLARSLSVPEMHLSLLEGVKCQTASQAYPVIVDLLRQHDRTADVRDDAGQPMVETEGFKLVITEPLTAPVPKYWAGSETLLDKYVEDVLESDHGRIGKHLMEPTQLRAFVKHLSEYVKPGRTFNSTRRAILIVDNHIVDNEPRPLGLVSVWATPRQAAGATVLDFCWVWRTVEALVGFPYSLYGSIRVSESLTKKIAAQVGFPHPENLAVGRLTYLALSLHMRRDEFHKRIAKGIVDAASY